ncbi:unnamed protein product [Heterobilharzia americana]|nr:unnamed protein product [Heterobilharzia americana]
MKSTHEKELSTLKDKCEMAEAQREKENQLNHEELCRKDAEIERLNNQINELIKRLDASLSIREKLQFDFNQLNEQFVRTKRECENCHEQVNSVKIPNLQNSVDIANDNKENDESNTACTPYTNSVTNSQKETHSIRRLRNLYDLIHDLMLKLNDVRFTQNSVVEMVNRSLATMEIESSFQAHPLRKAVSVFGDLDHLSSNPNRFILSRTDATFGGYNTLFENMNISSTINPPIASSYCEHQLKESIVSSELNETVAALLFGCPKSPVRANLRCTSARNGNSHISKLFPLRYPTVQKSMGKNVSLHRKLFSAPKFKDQMKNLVGSASMCEDLRDSMQNIKQPDLLYHSLTEDVHDITSDRSTKKPTNIGDLTMVEWEHKDIFERLSLAMSRLRDAIEECSEIGSEFWDLDVKKHISVLLTSQVDSAHSCANLLNDSVEDVDSVALDAKETGNVDSKSVNCSARFDGGVLPPFDPIGFVSQNDEASLSQLYGSAWRHPMRLSTKCNDKNLIMSDIQGSQSFLESNQLLKESVHQITSGDDYERLTCELKDLNDKVITLEAENSNLKKANADLLQKMNTTIETANHEIIPTDPDSSIAVLPSVVSDNQQVDKLTYILAHCQEKNLSQQMNDLDLYTELSSYTALIHNVVERLQSVVNSGSECMNVIDLVDIAVSELAESRTSVNDLKDQMYKLEKCLHESVSLYDYQSLENEVDSLKEELQDILNQTNQYKMDVHYACSSLAPLLSLNESVSLKTLVDGVVDMYNNQETRFNSLTTEMQSVLQHSFGISDSYSIPETLDECIEMLKNNLSDYKTTIDQLKSDKMHSLDMIKTLAPNNQGLCTLSDYVNWFINTFNDKQYSFEALERKYFTVQESLYQSIQKYEDLQTTVNSLSEELQNSQNQVKNLQNELTDVIKTRVTMEKYDLMVSQLNAAEEELCINREKTVEYEKEREFIKQLIEDILLKQSSSLKDDIQELCTRLNDYKKSSELNMFASVQCETNVGGHETKSMKLTIEKTSCINIPDNLSLIGDEIITKEYNEPDDCCIKVTQPTDKRETLPQSLSLNDHIESSTSLRKYNELKTTAFEIRNKLISRTQKLETALKEIDRLRSVIEQDKERASKTLEEVKELRQKVLRKNQRIRDLEADVARLNLKLVVKVFMQVTHRLVDYHQNLNNIEVAELGSTSASLLHCPVTPSDSTENLLEQLADCTVSYDSVSLDNTQDPISLVNNAESTPPIQSGGCSRCHQLNKLLPELHNTTIHLKKLITLNLSHEDSLLDAFSNLEQHANSSSISCSQSLIDGNVKLLNFNNGLVDQSVLSTQMHLSLTDGMKTYMESLHHARLKLRHYARKMDHLCTSLVYQCDQCIHRNQKVSLGNQKTLADLLVSIINRLEGLFNQENLSDSQTAENILTDLQQLLDWIQHPSVHDIQYTHNKTSEDNHNCLMETKSSHSHDEIQKLKSQVKQYRRKYHQLLLSIDTVTKNLADTTDVISSTRTRLENVAGLSPIIDQTQSKK